MFVYSNLAISLDGKIATRARGHTPLGTKADWDEMKRLRRKADAILMGADSLRAFKKPCLAVPSTQSSPLQPINLLLSHRLEGISPTWPFFKEPKIRRILFLAEPLPKAKQKAFETSSEIVFLKKGPRAPSLANQIIAYLQKRGVHRLLVEGGGSVMWEFVRENLIDEYHVTLTPHVLGGKGAPTLVDGEGFLPQSVVNLKLTQARQIGHELYLIYRKLKKRGPTRGTSN